MAATQHFFPLSSSAKKWMGFLMTSLMPIKFPFGLSLYFNVFQPLVGLIYLLKERTLYLFLIPFMLLPILNLPHHFFFHSLDRVPKLGHLFLLGGLLAFFLKFFTKEFFSQFLNYFFYFCLSLSCLELILVYLDPLASVKNVFIFNIKYIKGLVGEPNYSGLIFLGLAYLFIMEKKWGKFLLCYILLIFTANRGALLTTFVTFPILLIFSFLPKLRGKLTWLLFAGLILYPVWIEVLYWNLPLNWKGLQFLEFNSSGRFYTHKLYIEMLKDYPWGIGYHNGMDNFIIPYTSRYAEEIVISNSTQQAQQHNLFLQVLVDFGLHGYLLFTSFLAFIIYQVQKVSSYKSLIFLCFLSVFVFYNGLSDFILYLFIAYLLIRTDQVKSLSTISFLKNPDKPLDVVRPKN